jgi:hypothetical protein
MSDSARDWDHLVLSNKPYPDSLVIKYIQLAIFVHICWTSYLWISKGRPPSYPDVALITLLLIALYVVDALKDIRLHLVHVEKQVNATIRMCNTLDGRLKKTERSVSRLDKREEDAL